MPKLLGITPEYGIPSQEDGLLLDSLEFSWVPEWYNQKNEKGRISGKLLVDEYMSVTIGGALALGSTLSYKGGAPMTLANAVPDLWAETPQATTNLVADVSHSYSNSDARKASLTVEVYGFSVS